MRNRREFDLSHERVSVLAPAHTIRAGDLILHQHGWCPVTRVSVLHPVVLVSFEDTSRDTWPVRTKEFSTSKRARVRRAKERVDVRAVH